MSFELRRDESLRKGLRRVARKQMDDVLEALAGEHGEPRDEVVHDARKAFKKVRALLRLVRPRIGDGAYRRENTCFRDAARPLTQVRDAKILIETVDGLAEHFKGRVAGRPFDDVRAALRADLRAVRKRVLDEQDAFAVAAEAVRQARERVKAWADVPNRWRALGEGLEDTYSAASSAFADAAADPTVEKLHEWRNQAKYLRHQLEVLRPLWPERLVELAGEADRMSDLLGDDHDLAVLRQTLTGDPARFGDDGERELLPALIDRRCAELQEEGTRLGRRFFQDRPRGFSRRLRGYWKAWRADAVDAAAAGQNTPA